MTSRDAVGSVERVLNRVRALARRDVRERDGCLWLEGIRHFVAAVDAGLTFEAVVIAPVLVSSDLAEMLARRLAAAGVPRVRVTPEQFRSVSGAARASGVGAIVRPPWTSLDATLRREGPGWLVVESIRSPGNLGTILRTAEAVGANGVVLLGPDVDPFDPAVVRAAMGGVFAVPLVRATPDRFARWAATRGVTTVGLSPDGEHAWTDLPPGGRVAVLVGEERAGLSGRLRGLCRTTVRLPMAGRADSLNVAVAAGVMLYELVRRAERSA